MTKKHTLSRAALALTNATLALGLSATLMSSASVNAQGIASHNTRAPVSVDASRIDVQERENRVAFSGDVVVTQAELTVRAQRMLLNYVDTQTLELQRITATGGVSVARGNELATGSTAIYDFNRRIITLAGDVRLRRGENTLKGGRIVIDLDTGMASLDGKNAPAGGGSNGRVRGTFSVPQNP